MSVQSRTALYRRIRADLLWHAKAYRRGNNPRLARQCQTEMADARAQFSGAAYVSPLAGYVSGADRVALRAAVRRVAETGETVTVWHDCGGDEPFTLPGVAPCPHRACQRVATVRPH